MLLTSKKPSPSFALFWRPFRIYWGGTLPARIGEWADFIVLNWAVLQLSRSPLDLGVLNVCRLLPIFLFSWLGGVLADRLPRRQVLAASLLGMAGSTLAIAWLLHEPSSLIWLFAAVFVRSVFMAIETAVRNAYIADLVPGAALSSAISLHTAALHIGKMFGPAAAGWWLASMDGAPLLVVYSALLIAAALAVSSLEDGRPRRPAVRPAEGDKGEAIRYIRDTPLIRALLALSLIPMTFGFAYSAVTPLLVDAFAKGDAGDFALLLSVSSAGALLGTAWLSFRPVEAVGKWLIVSLLAFSLSLLLWIVSFEHQLLCLAAMALAGLTGQLYRTLCRLAVQLTVPDQLRGRIMSIALMDRGFIPLGTLLLTAIAEYAGAKTAGYAMGWLCLLCVLAFWRRKELWNISTGGRTWND
ncbi:MFS transporter [Geobacillus subterraneus]|uniref:MFS transporter n=1 Tax=Geobacillus subterraneus TaxID=129338 RepID=UPI001442AC46|nr:MFS transporter [Geobacillus subterraneus]QIZ66545.1 MFS transporter [Geobacillus subterraneus]